MDDLDGEVGRQTPVAAPDAVRTATPRRCAPGRLVLDGRHTGRSARPTHGIFVETRLRKLIESGAVSARVVAPCPWFPFTSSKFGAYAAFARTPRSETRHGIEIDHPRYPLLPKIGMNSAPLAIFAASRMSLITTRRFAPASSIISRTD